jgi:hypothetical protein
MTPYPIIDVSNWRRFNEEPMGTKAKFWLAAPGGQLWLFKYFSQGGDDWAEKIAAELAKALTMPHSHAELARYGDRFGVISLDFTGRASKGALLLGNALLQDMHPDYPTQRRFKVAQHTVPRVLAFLSRDIILLPDPGTWRRVGTDEFYCAADIFVGYLMLDALIGNTDRHHENWGVLQLKRFDSKARAELAPTFDHAASMGQILQEAEREKRLTTKDPRFAVEAYAEKARSSFYSKEEEQKQLTTLEAFAASAKEREPAARAWLNRLAGLTERHISEIVNGVPPQRMSDATKQFVTRYLIHNRKRLLLMEQP